MLEKQQENLQQPKNDNGKRLFYVILVALGWLLFVFGLLMCSSKCAKASSYEPVASAQSNMSNNNKNSVLKVKTGVTSYDYYWGSKNRLYKYNDTTKLYDDVTSDITWTGDSYNFSTYNMTCSWSATYYCLFAYNQNHYLVDFHSSTITQIHLRLNGSSSDMQINGATSLTSDGTYIYIFVSGHYYNTNIIPNVSYSSGQVINLTDMSSNMGSTAAYGYYWKLTHNGLFLGFTSSGSVYHDCTITSSSISCQVTQVSNSSYFEYFNYVGNDIYFIKGDYGTVYQLDRINWTNSLVNISDLPFELFSDYYSYGSQYYSYPNAITYTFQNFLFNSFVVSSGGGYTQEDLDNAYDEGYSEGYSAGQLDSDNYQEGYDAGLVYALDYVSDHGGNGVHHSTYTDEHLQYQLDYIYKEGQVSIANAASSYQYGSGEVYTRFQNMVGAVHEEMDYAYQLGYDAGSNYAEDYWTRVLLNIASGQNGTGTVYNSFNMIDYTNELSTIYSTGVTNGADENYDSTYSAGYSAGQSIVLDNPSYYDLYSKNDYNNAVASARATGYAEGYHIGINTDSADLPSTIIAIASVPYVVLSSMFNFNVLGINIFIFVTSLISLVIVIWVIKKIWK